MGSAGRSSGLKTRTPVVWGDNLAGPGAARRGESAEGYHSPHGLPAADSAALREVYNLCAGI